MTQPRDQRNQDRPAQVGAPDGSIEGRIKAVFKAQFRHLSKLFPTDGETMVNRACAAACSAAREIDKKTGALKLGSASPESIAEKVIACHHLGLEIGDQAYLVPFGQDVQLIVGPRGLIALMYRSGFVRSVEARSVFDGDDFEYDLGDSGFIRHRKAMTGRRDAPITHAYFIAKTSTEGTIREVLTWEDIEYYRSFSKAGKGGAWDTNYEGMCRKTALKRGAEFVPRSAMLVAALRENDQGGYEIPEEIMAAVRAKTAGEAGPPQPEVVYEPATPAAANPDHDGR